MTKTTFTWLVLAFPCLVFAQDEGNYRCTQGDLVRRVEILTEPGVPVPCEVHYYKDTEAPGEMQVLWSAQSQAGYCEEKTAAFIAKLEGWGWDCESGSDAMPADEAGAPAETGDGGESAPETDDEEPAPPAYDDTDVLSPGGEGVEG